MAKALDKSSNSKFTVQFQNKFIHLSKSLKYYISRVPVPLKILENFRDLEARTIENEYVVLNPTTALYVGCVYRAYFTKSGKLKFIVKVECRKPAQDQTQVQVKKLRGKDLVEIKSLRKGMKGAFLHEENQKRGVSMNIDQGNINKSLSDLEILKINPDVFIGEFLIFDDPAFEVHFSNSLDAIIHKKARSEHKQVRIVDIEAADIFYIDICKDLQVNTAEVYSFLKYDPYYPYERLVKRRAMLFSHDNGYILKLKKPLKPLTFKEVGMVSFSPSVSLPELIVLKDYNEFRIPSNYTPLNLESDLLISNTFKKYKSLSYAIGLSLLENYYRIPEISFLSSYKNPSLAEIVSNIKLTNKSFGLFYQSIARFMNIIESIGTSILENIKADVEKLSYFQELSHTLDIIIYLSDFTDSPFRVCFNPDTPKKQVLEIIHLGKYYNSYFVIYPKETYQFEGAYYNNFNQVESWPLSYPFALKLGDDNNEIYESFKLILDRIMKINQICLKKTKGDFSETLPNASFFEEGNKINEIARKGNQKSLGEIANILMGLDFTDLHFNITPPQFICYCCQRFFPDIIKHKVQYQCGCQYYFEHNNNMVQQHIRTCSCQRSYLQFINS